MGEGLAIYVPKGPRKLVDAFLPEFLIRPHSTDVKAIEAVWSKQAYRRHRDGFQPEPGDVWLDIGSHVGAFGVMAHKFGAEVISVEAEESNVAMTATNLELNGVSNPQVIEAACVPDEFIGDKATLYVSPDSTRRHSIARQRNTSTQVEVPAVKISTLVDEYRPDGVKLSIEGAEIQMLHSWEIPECVRYVVVEWNFEMDDRLHTLASGFERLASRYRKVDMSKKVNISKPKYDLFPANVHLYGWE